VAILDGPLDGREKMRRRTEAERDRVADVQVSNADTACLNLLRLGDDISDGVCESVNTCSRWNKGMSVGAGHGPNFTLSRAV
jgi:hypothetical protein